MDDNRYSASLLNLEEAIFRTSLRVTRQGRIVDQFERKGLATNLARGLLAPFAQYGPTFSTATVLSGPNRAEG